MCRAPNSSEGYKSVKSAGSLLRVERGNHGSYASMDSTPTRWAILLPRFRSLLCTFVLPMIQFSFSACPYSMIPNFYPSNISLLFRNFGNFCCRYVTVEESAARSVLCFWSLSEMERSGSRPLQFLFILWIQKKDIYVVEHWALYREFTSEFNSYTNLICLDCLVS